MSRILEGIYTEEDMRLHDTYIATAAKNVLTQRMKIAKFHKAANPGKRVRDPDMPVRLQLGGNKTPNKHKRTGLSNRIRYGFNKGTVVKFMRRAGVRRANFKGGIYEDTVNALSSWFTEIKERMGPMIVYTTRHTRIFALQAMLYSIKTAKAVNVYINDDFMKEGEPLWVSKKYKYGDVPFDVHDPAREADPTWEPRSKRDAINPPL
jgi:hypothetical protein